MDSLMNMIEGWPIVAQVLSAMVGFNLVIVGIVKILDVFKDKTKTDADNKLHALLSRLQSLIGALAAYKK